MQYINSKNRLKIDYKLSSIGQQLIILPMNENKKTCIYCHPLFYLKKDIKKCFTLTFIIN